jgi:hypothetical protein
MNSTSSLLLLPGAADPEATIDLDKATETVASSSTSAVRRLASLNVALCECAEKLPSMARGSVSSAGTSDNDRHKTVVLAVDELFRLTADFVELVKTFTFMEYETSDTLSTADQREPTWALSPMTCSPQRPHAFLPLTKTGTRPTQRSLSHMDEATAFMVVSCHCRLVDIYTSIFKMVQACVEHSFVPQLGPNWAVILPRLQVGSFDSPPVTVDANAHLSPITTSMYMVMITMLSSQLWEQLGSTIRAGIDVATGSESMSRCTLVSTMWNTVMVRTDQLVQTINVTQSLLQR